MGMMVYASVRERLAEDCLRKKKEGKVKKWKRRS